MRSRPRGPALQRRWLPQPQPAIALSLSLAGARDPAGWGRRPRATMLRRGRDVRQRETLEPLSLSSLSLLSLPLSPSLPNPRALGPGRGPFWHSALLVISAHSFVFLACLSAFSSLAIWLRPGPVSALCSLRFPPLSVCPSEFGRHAPPAALHPLVEALAVVGAPPTSTSCISGLPCPELAAAARGRKGTENSGGRPLRRTSESHYLPAGAERRTPGRGAAGRCGGNPSPT